MLFFAWACYVLLPRLIARSSWFWDFDPFFLSCFKPFISVNLGLRRWVCFRWIEKCRLNFVVDLELCLLKRLLRVKKVWNMGGFLLFFRALVRSNSLCVHLLWIYTLWMTLLGVCHQNLARRWKLKQHRFCRNISGGTRNILRRSFKEGIVKEG